MMTLPKSWRSDVSRPGPRSGPCASSRQSRSEPTERGILDNGLGTLAGKGPDGDGVESRQGGNCPAKESERKCRYVNEMRYTVRIWIFNWP